VGRNQEQRMQEPSLFEEDYMTPREIPTFDQAVLSLSTHPDGDTEWLERGLLDGAYYDNLNDKERLEILRLIIAHGSASLKEDLFISLRCFLYEHEDVQSCAPINYRRENESD